MMGREVSGGCITCDDDIVSILCEFTAFGCTLHWPASHFGVSFLEVLILFEQMGWTPVAQ